ncbi:MAG: tyrosine-type recombinase/integrase [Gammaproteobacteria bacterium]|nr:tyrosine-type recombinase/integrase [Gammaproteobacteria bacterium]
MTVVRGPALALVPFESPARLDVLRQAGPQACFAAEEFFTARIRNPHTRKAYAVPVRRFLHWLAAQDIPLVNATPGQAARFLDGYGGSVPTQKLALSALRHFFDLLVTRHAVALNPFQSVRPPRSESREGKTPEITVAQTRDLLASIDPTSRAGVRDRAVLGTLIYTGARAGAVAALRLQDLRDYGDHRTLLMREKRGKQREIPVRIDLDAWIAAYLAAAELRGQPPDTPLFRVISPNSPSGFGATGIEPWTLRALLKRRLRGAGLPAFIRIHSFRAMVITDLLDQGVPMEDVQYLAGHSDPSTTQLYDRRSRSVSRNIVERISV